MIRIGFLSYARVRAASIALLALAVLVVAHPAAAQQQTPAPAAPQQEPADVLKFGSNAPALILIQIHADKTADFESAWTSMRAAFGKVQDAELKSFGETLGKLYKVDQPPIDTPLGKAALYVLQLDAPSTTYSYNPVKIVYDQLWKSGGADPYLSREEADAIYNKFKTAFQSINPPWKLNKIG